MRQLKGLQLNHFAISCVRTSESGVILSLTTMMMHGIYKDNLRSQVVNERGFLDSLYSGQCQGHTCRLTICGTPMKAVVDESVSNYRAIEGCFKVLLVFKVPFYKGHHPVELFCSSQLFDPLITLEFNTFHSFILAAPTFLQLAPMPPSRRRT